MPIATLPSSTRTKVINYHTESGSESPSVLAFGGVGLWDFYRTALRGIIPKESLVLTQFLGETERVARERGPFNAYILDLDRIRGTEFGLRDGIDLGEKLVKSIDDIELIWMLSSSSQTLTKASDKRFTRLYEKSKTPLKYPSLDQFVEDIRQDLTYGRRAL